MADSGFTLVVNPVFICILWIVTWQCMSSRIHMIPLNPYQTRVDRSSLNWYIVLNILMTVGGELGYKCFDSQAYEHLTLLKSEWAW